MQDPLACWCAVPQLVLEGLDLLRRNRDLSYQDDSQPTGTFILIQLGPQKTCYVLLKVREVSIQLQFEDVLVVAP